ncbi:transposase DNA-binding-containing protein [Bradyrhizobium sp. DASA03005]|uniref:transposase DNA-binding-containing protein n=1 Tax=Bradyrhizobium sp. SPXBL-02 TaxID=3395912 RepID=UPI003F718820
MCISRTGCRCLVVRMMVISAVEQFMCQDWANTKAAYLFFANERVEEAEVLSGHFPATRALR